MDDVTRIEAGSTDLTALPVIRTLEAEVRTILSQPDYSITDADSYKDAAGTLGRVKSALKQIEEQRTSITQPINESLRRINAQAKDASAPWLEVERKIKRAIVAYDEEQDRIRREAQRRADEEARKERERLEKQAAKAAAAGKDEKAADLELRAATVVAPVVAAETPKVEGVSRRLVVKFDITDPAAVPRNYCTPDEKKIRKIVDAMNGDIEIPGVRIWKESVIAARAAG